MGLRNEEVLSHSTLTTFTLMILHQYLTGKEYAYAQAITALCRLCRVLLFLERREPVFICTTPKMMLTGLLRESKRRGRYFMDNDSMYVEHIMDHYNNPRNYGTIANADFHLRELNPLCGDEIDMFVKLTNTKAHIMFKGKGCAISQAAASLLTEATKGKTIAEIKKITNEDMIQMLAIPISHVRLKCAVLALKTLEKGIHLYEGEHHA